jgi:hypothetical protein
MVELPEPFHTQHKELLAEFALVRDTYKYYAEEIIHPDNVLVRKALQFLIDVLSHIEAQYDRAPLHAWGVFLGNFTHEFQYGDRQNRHNYLDLPDLDVENMLEKFDSEKDPELRQLTSVRKKLEKALTHFEAA